MDHIPSNARLWKLYVARAKQKFHHYPSPAASHWVHDQYVKAGGRFVAADHADRETIRVSEEKYKKYAKEHHKTQDEDKKGK